MTGCTKQNDAPFVLGVAGGSGSGKTFFAKALIERLGSSLCEIVYQDNFYIDQSEKFDVDGGKVNFDHPSSIDFDLLALTLQKLRAGLETEIPIYDFAHHQRMPDTLVVKPLTVIVVDGILIFHSKKVRDLCHQRIFFHTSEEIRFKRRLERDVRERGRTPEGVRTQFVNQVKPMHDTFVEPSRIHAGQIVSDSIEFNKILDTLCFRFEAKN